MSSCPKSFQDQDQDLSICFALISVHAYQIRVFNLLFRASGAKRCIYASLTGGK